MEWALFPSCRQLYLSSFIDTHTQTQTHTDTHTHTQPLLFFFCQNGSDRLINETGLDLCFFFFFFFFFFALYLRVSRAMLAIRQALKFFSSHCDTHTHTRTHTQHTHTHTASSFFLLPKWQ